MPLQLQPCPHLAPGDKVAAITVSWGGPAIFPYRYHAGKQRLRDVFGLSVVEMANTHQNPDWLKAHPKERASDLMDAFKDPTIRGIFSTIGGNDAIDLLPYIDYEVIKNNPKVFVGFSDTTVLNFILLKAGIASFYGPSIMCELAENVSMSNYTHESLRKVLFSSGVPGEINCSDCWSDEMLDWGNQQNQNMQRVFKKNDGWQYLQGEGVVSGQLIGGCLETLDKIIDTEVWPNQAAWKDCILFLEISEEKPAPDVVEKMLNKFIDKGVLTSISGILFGRPGGQSDVDLESKYEHLLVKAANTVNRPTLPIVSKMDFGHTIPVFVIPVGATARIDCENKKFYIDSSACMQRLGSTQTGAPYLSHWDANQSRFNLNVALNKKLAIVRAGEQALVRFSNSGVQNGNKIQDLLPKELGINFNKN